MKSRQLANVLIKMLGFSVCLYAIPSCISGFLLGVSHLRDSETWLAVLPMISYPIGAAIQAAIGLLIISKSSKIAGWMFKSDEE